MSILFFCTTFVVIYFLFKLIFTHIFGLFFYMFQTSTVKDEASVMIKVSFTGFIEKKTKHVARISFF